MSLATKLVALRKEKGLTQMDLAEKLNVSRQAISRWEVGAAVPSTDNLKILGDLYGVPVDYLLDDTNDYFSKDIENKGCYASESVTGDKKNKHRVLYSILVVFLLIVTLVVMYLMVPRQQAEDPIPISQMEEDIESNYTTYTFTME